MKSLVVASNKKNAPYAYIVKSYLKKNLSIIWKPESFYYETGKMNKNLENLLI